VLARDVHLNLIGSSRHLFRMDPGAEVESRPGWVFAAGRSSHPVISNAAFRLDDELDPVEFLGAANRFFAGHGRGFAVWARSGLRQDEDLIEASEAGGLTNAYEMPEMVLREPLSKDRQGPDGVELRRVSGHADARDYWQVATDSYASVGFPPEIFAFYERDEPLMADGVAAFVASLDGRAVGIAMTIVSGGIAGIYWVGTTEAARGRGVGRMVTAAAVGAGFEMGAEIASLQASPMGEPLYSEMGFETLFRYRLLLSAPPAPA
jgi:GNAT superfamily N-acetyltransferase